MLDGEEKTAGGKQGREEDAYHNRDSKTKLEIVG